LGVGLNEEQIEQNSCTKPRTYHTQVAMHMNREQLNSVKQAFVTSPCKHLD